MEGGFSAPNTFCSPRKNTRQFCTSLHRSQKDVLKESYNLKYAGTNYVALQPPWRSLCSFSSMLVPPHLQQLSREREISQKSRCFSVHTVPPFKCIKWHRISPTEFDFPQFEQCINTLIRKPT